MDPRPLDPSHVWVRHVRHDPGAETAAPGSRIGARLIPGADAVDVAGGRYVVQEDGIGGPAGWQDAGVTLALSDHGTFTLRLPNGTGEDGVLHRRRFELFTSDDYDPGDEWLEFWRDPHDLIAVGTPTGGAKSPGEVTVTGVCVAGTLDGFRSSEVDAWDPSAPVDVARHYLRAPVLSAAIEPAAVASSPGWLAAGVVNPVGVATDVWAAEARFRWTAATSAGRVALEGGGVNLQVVVADGTVEVTGTAVPESAVTGKRNRLAVPGPIALRVVAFYDRVLCLVEGELVAEFRRSARPPADTFTAWVLNGAVVLDALEVTTLAPYAARTAAATVDRRLPGIPPATGLRARYYNAAGITRTTLAGRVSRLWPLAMTGVDIGAVEPTTDRHEPTLDLTTTAPGMAGAYAARWEGAIYLDLAASDRELRLVSPTGGTARLYVGKTLRGADEAASSWGTATAATITAAGLRALIGQSSAGWYPLVVEAARFDANGGGWRLEDRAAGGAWATVPTTRLSPIGTYGELARHQPHREVFDGVLSTFGYQWREVPQSLESGGFPGQIAIAPLIGTPLDVEITDADVGTDVAVEVKADDVGSGMAADAAGIADPKGAEQLAARIVDYDRATGKPTLRVGYESLAEITEAPMLRTRLRSLVALKSSPNETVGVRSLGQRDLVDTFPLTGVLRLNRWTPGDGVRLRLESVDVLDTSTRQLTRIAWTLRPNGVGHPVVGFRQRTRNPRAALKRILRIALAPNRTAQAGSEAGRTY